MTETIPKPPITDPDNIPETLCDGVFNLYFQSGLAYLTFTHARPDAGPLFDGTVEQHSIVRARIVTTLPNIVALKELLNRMLVDANAAPTTATGGTTRH
jgi:hypothetical protein